MSRFNFQAWQDTTSGRNKPGLKSCATSCNPAPLLQGAAKEQINV